MRGNMENPEQLFELGEKKNPFNVEELRDLLDKCQDEWIDSRERGKEDRQNYEEFYDKKYRELINRLIQEKDRFAHIFKTENGSVYFTLFSGHSQRIKAREGRFYDFSKQPMVNDHFFVSQKAKVRIMKIVEKADMDFSSLLECPIITTELKVGVYPVELNIYKYGTKFATKVERTRDNVVLKYQGKQSSSIRPQISNGIHVGNQVVEILK
jgi:hypothetical protein